MTRWTGCRTGSLAGSRRERLVERRRDAEDLYAESAIRAGRHDDVLGDLHRMVAQQPTREQRWGLLALAQYRAGRQAEALGTLARARATLVNEFGLDPGPALAELEESILRQDPALLSRGRATDHRIRATVPTWGWSPTTSSDAPAYFGREADVSACLARLDQAGVLAVVGPSGSGKSSLIRAGVAAALVRDGHLVQVVTPGAHPEDVLAARRRQGPGRCSSSTSARRRSPWPRPPLSGRRSSPDWSTSPRGAGWSSRCARTVSASPGRAPRRSPTSWRTGLYLLGAMGPAQLRSAIEGPAAQAGLRLEPGLVDLLVREAEGSPSALPLLSHVLRQTWRRREGSTP